MVRRDQTIKALAEQFVTVRIVKCNGLDLNLFQFDFDLTFAVFFLNPDMTIYARYGTRTGHDADQDVHIEGLAATMTSVLETHKDFKNQKKKLTGKQPGKSTYLVPEDFPKLKKFKSKLDYSGAVAKSCIHCHQVREAQRLVYRDAKKPLPEKLMFPFPKSEIIGVSFDKTTKSTIAKVLRGSPAAKSILQPGDEIVETKGTLISSEADFHWMLHQLADEKKLPVLIRRDGKEQRVEIKLPKDWRKKADIAWRPTSWDLRRMATGGLSLKPIAEVKRRQLKIPAGQMALEATHVGRYGAHARAMRAGMRKGDVVISFDGQTDLLSETAINEYAVQKKLPGDEITIEYMRGSRKRTAKIRLQ